MTTDQSSHMPPFSELSDADLVKGISENGEAISQLKQTGTNPQLILQYERENEQGPAPMLE